MELMRSQSCVLKKSGGEQGVMSMIVGQQREGLAIMQTDRYMAVKDMSITLKSNSREHRS